MTYTTLNYIICSFISKFYQFKQLVKIWSVVKQYCMSSGCHIYMLMMTRIQKSCTIWKNTHCANWAHLSWQTSNHKTSSVYQFYAKNQTLHICTGVRWYQCQNQMDWMITKKLLVLLYNMVLKNNLNYSSENKKECVYILHILKGSSTFIKKC